MYIWLADAANNKGNIFFYEDIVSYIYVLFFVYDKIVKVLKKEQHVHR